MLLNSLAKTFSMPFLSTTPQRDNSSNSMPKNHGNVIGENGDDLTNDADIDDVPPESRLNGDSAGLQRGAHESRPAVDVEDDGDDEDEDDDDDEGEEYQVEAIEDHQVDTPKGGPKTVLYYIKWVGYPKDENTWEPEENLLPHARDLLSAYHKRVGGDPALKLKKSKSVSNLRAQATETPPAKRRKVAEIHSDMWVPSKGDWTPEVEKVDTIERDETGQLQVYLKFRNGKTTKVSMDRVKKHCPVPMLEFYELNLKFNDG